MASQVYYSPFIPQFSSNGLPVGNARLYFFYTGTNALAPIFADADLTTPIANPIISNAAGRYPNIYLDSDVIYRVRATDVKGTPLQADIDPYVPGQATTYVPDTPTFASPGGAALVGDKRPDVGAIARNQHEINLDTISVQSFGAKGDGSTDDTSAIIQALVIAQASGRRIDMRGTFAVSRLKFPGGLTSGSVYMNIVGDPTFVQAVPNQPVIEIQDSVLQQSCGHRFSCTVIPHPSSSKSNPANIAVNLTGFSAGDFLIRLGQASSYTSTSGRFHTVVYHDSASPFSYGNRIGVIANAVPAPHIVVKSANRGLGAIGNPNINQYWAYINSLDTEAGDILLDLGDSTQATVTAPTLLESCPNATGIKAGNLTTIRESWIELVGQAIDFSGTSSTTPNNCRVERVQFSGPSHIIKINNGLGAPPEFVGCLGDVTNVTYQDQAGSPLSYRPTSTRTYSQPANPTITFVTGGGVVSNNISDVKFRVDHHGRCVFHLQYFVTPTSAGPTQMRIVPPADFVVETAVVGVRTDSGTWLTTGLGDNSAGTDFGWSWTNTLIHAVNIRVVLRSSYG